MVNMGDDGEVSDVFDFQLKPLDLFLLLITPEKVGVKQVLIIKT